MIRLLKLPGGLIAAPNANRSAGEAAVHERCLAKPLHEPLLRHAREHVTGSAGPVVVKAHLVASAFGVTSDMSFAQVGEHLSRNRAAHDAHQFTHAERGDGKYCPPSLLCGKALLRHHFLPREEPEMLTWELATRGTGHELPLVMSSALTSRFRGFLASHTPRLEPDFLLVGNWALLAVGAGPNISPSEAAALLSKSRRARDPNATFTKKERRNAYTTDVAMREALRMLCVCLNVV